MAIMPEPITISVPAHANRDQTHMLDFEKAMTFIMDADQAIRNGTRHYSMTGELLEHPLAILNALRRDGVVRMERS